MQGRYTGFGLPVAVACFCLASLLVGYPPPEVPEPAGNSFLVAFGLMLALAVVGLAAVEQLIRRTPDALRWNVWPLCVGLGGLFAFELVLFTDALLFRVLDQDLWIARGLVQALVIPLLGLAVARNREWTFDVSFSRSVALGSTALVGASIYLLVIAALGYHVRFFGGQWGTTIATALVFMALLLFGFVAASRTMRSKLRVLVAKNFLAFRYDYREEWLKFTGLIAQPGGGRSLHDRCVLALGELVETASGALWLRRDGGYRLVARLAQPEVTDREPEDGELASFLRATGWVIDVGEARRDPEKYRDLQLPQWLRASPNAWLVVPLLVTDGLLGFIVLGRPRVDLKLDWEVLDLLKTAARQTAGFLAQQEATEALLEARKFESFNHMSAFVVHDLKNLVAQLQLMLHNAERHHANPEFQRDMLSTVGHVVARMNNLMLQLRSGERPVDRPHAVDLCSVLSRVQGVRAAGHGNLRVDLVDDVIVMGHPDRLERVIGHLVQNALEAGDPSTVARHEVRVRVYRQGDSAVIEVADNGVGMSADFVRERLFKPFSSTKQSGMGIGTYESQQYVQSIGGRIDVESRPSTGTTFRVTLRLADPAEAAQEALE
ncbi:MAG: XrtA/PEP-CTERM system histidine kinase PrsK [Burkholderiaceae bacterium]|nr:XrtA/PEP-CTERM system histidine kinase PrsK [Burkholderiaceae bacterium]